MPMVTQGPSRRFVVLLVTACALLSIIFVSTFRNARRQEFLPPPGPDRVAFLAGIDEKVPAMVDRMTLTGNTIMPKLGNETAKAELGRSAWRLFHTIMARFPDTPTADERTALQSYIHLFVRLYPCGECAEHFRQIVDRFPPQVSSRSAAAAWACHVHNEVNKSLGKEIFDCSNIGDFYDCGCADEEKEDMGVIAEGKAGSDEMRREKPQLSAERKEKLTGANGREFNMDLLTGDTPLKLEKEGWSRGG